jgi:hypothetical protein
MPNHTTAPAAIHDVDMTPEGVAKAFAATRPGCKVAYVGGGWIRVSVLSGGAPCTYNIRVTDAFHSIRRRAAAEAQRREAEARAAQASDLEELDSEEAPTARELLERTALALSRVDLDRSPESTAELHALRVAIAKALARQEAQT